MYLTLADYFYKLSLIQIPYMTLAWVLCVSLRNGSFVDFAWPSGFMIMAIQIFYNSEGHILRKLFICIPYILCGLRFTVGWLFGRKHYKREDRRWELWRETWRNGDGIFSIRSEAFNFFIFYHCQSFTNVFVMSVPLIFTCNNKSENIDTIEIVGLIIWIISFYLENKADYQLARFKISKDNRQKVMQTGLWKYSRHPNYFFEWTIWISYTIITFPSIRNTTQAVHLMMTPLIAYFFLVYFTGVPMCEKASLQRRGSEYAEYQSKTNMFFPWFIKKIIS